MYTKAISTKIAKKATGKHVHPTVDSTISLLLNLKTKSQSIFWKCPFFVITFHFFYLIFFVSSSLYLCVSFFYDLLWTHFGAHRFHTVLKKREMNSLLCLHHRGAGPCKHLETQQTLRFTVYHRHMPWAITCAICKVY